MGVLSVGLYSLGGYLGFGFVRTPVYLFCNHLLTRPSAQQALSC